MEGLVVSVGQDRSKSKVGNDFLTLSKDSTPVTTNETEQKSSTRKQFGKSSAEEALEVLKAEPDYETLLLVLRYLKETRGSHTFNIQLPSPLSGQIVHILIIEIVPNYWDTLKKSSSSAKKGARDVDLLLACLRSIAGINSALAYLRALVKETKGEPKSLKKSPLLFQIVSIMDLLSLILHPDDQVQRIWKGVSSILAEPAKLRPLRQEFISILAGGKIVPLTAEAEALLTQADHEHKASWAADSKQYIHWIGRNLVRWIKSTGLNDDLQISGEILGRALKLAHGETLVNVLFQELLLDDSNASPKFATVLGFLAAADQRKILSVVLKLLASQLTSVDMDDETENYPLIWASATVIKNAIVKGENGRGFLVDWLIGPSGAGIGESSGIRRAALAVIGDNKELLTVVLEKGLGMFGDQLYIKHSPILQQEAHAQVILICAGYLHRLSPIKLNVLLRSSTYLSLVSNRIAASQVRARVLGMVIAETLSGLVHGKDNKLDFHVDETATENANWYKSLVNANDKLGPTSLLKAQVSPAHSERPPKEKTPEKTKEPVLRPARVPPRSGFIIEEIEVDEDENGEDEDENGEDEDDGLVPYAKPDSDAEDSDDDPTLINRGKPTAPVYIRDLIEYFRDSENYDRQKLALTTAPALIRRKADFGTEVSSHAEELATLLVGLQDKFELENFHQFRLQGMIAIVVAQPKKMGQWFSKTFFDGDYSLAQRASILIVLGLSGREIAGFNTSDYASAAAFPSKQLPAKVEKHFVAPSSKRAIPSSASLKALPPSALDSISQSLQQTFLAPLAASAADAATGPDALKLSSFTSRLKSATPASTGKPKRVGVRSIPNTTASVLSSSFFFPLASRFLAAIHSPSASARGILFEPSLLTVYLKTLALLLHASGPSTLSLPQMTSEFWDLLLAVRSHCVGHLDITHAVLFALMALLDVNETDMRGLCERQGREIVETVEWASGVFDNTRGGDDGGDGEENQVKMMAAGVLIRLKEAIEKYRALLMGDMIGVR